MFSHFTILALTIAGLGLFALSAFTAEQRKKEISFRKVLGQRTPQFCINYHSASRAYRCLLCAGQYRCLFCYGKMAAGFSIQY